MCLSNGCNCSRYSGCELPIGLAASVQFCELCWTIPKLVHGRKKFREVP